MPLTSQPDYPDELLWNGRGVDPVFDPTELLYFRVKSVDERGKVSGIDIPCPDTSVNRGKYSQPEYVLYARLPLYLDYKVMQFLVRDIPTTVISGDGRPFEFRIVHDPLTVKPPEDLDENYAHSEIRVFLKGTRGKNIPEKVRKVFRQTLSERMILVPLPPRTS